MRTRDSFMKMKKEKEPIVMLTAYDYPSARLAEQAGVEMILVGDSLGMVVLGYESTIPVTVEDMIHHTKAVKRGAGKTFIVTDMPFMSYHTSREDALRAGAEIMRESGAHALKLEGAGETLSVIRALTEGGIPVVSHLGLTPQTVGVLGGYKVQGKDAQSALKLIEDAKCAEASGAIAVVLECVPYQLSKRITEELEIPIIGIGAGSYTDGQVLVYHDVISYGVERLPKFVKTYGNANEYIEKSLREYVSDVKAKTFPSEEHSFTMKEEALFSLYGGK
ncbi:3-methyl-2-oxobutanoate hydroxymethyltransferase [Priestia endophytica]|uniref:3-methyl-2-oxobutanoate hydroxymethyltransferase n=1 Tax=Priestia endophytica TaxID=135735 RepID=UPI000DCA4DBA|nr:3-methyl-2-oxobutanoate hydroxymethyltransferase [Priestia endophytica]RAS89706.1 3-methyl-2-oxobutanoate hydroxymethyltransferase [Priestia endophytica]